MVFALIKALRPKQWIKNLLVGAPLLFAQKLFDPDAFGRAAAAFSLFCLVSSSVYLVNDLVDVDADRVHPKKRDRPIASGKLSPAVARGFVMLVVPATLLTAFMLSRPFAAALAAYFALQIAYCFGTKRVPYLDVLSIAAGFVLRVFSGALVIEVTASPWLLVCTALLAMFLGFGKRAHELGFARERAAGQRAALGGYSPTALRWILHALAVVTVVAYALYTQSGHLGETFAEGSLIYTLPFPIIGILRFIYLVTTRHDAESPTEEMLKDPLFMVNFVVFVVVALVVLYSPL